MGQQIGYPALVRNARDGPAGAERSADMDYSIVWVRGHVEVYDWAGRFCFSADSEREAMEELEQ